MSYDDVIKFFSISQDFVGDTTTFRISLKSLKAFVKHKQSI
jgi:hypothetical protein